MDWNRPYSTTDIDATHLTGKGPLTVLFQTQVQAGNGTQPLEQSEPIPILNDGKSFNLLRVMKDYLDMEAPFFYEDPSRVQTFFVEPTLATVQSPNVRNGVSSHHLIIDGRCRK